MRRLSLLMTLIASCFLFSGCGQSGPLYVPGNPSTMAVPPAQETADDAESEDPQESGESPETQ